jgi:hypothetical protein
MIMTSTDAAAIYRRAEHYWFRCPVRMSWRTPHFRTLRGRIDDGERMLWKDRFCARAVLLIAFWHRRAAERAAARERLREAMADGFAFKAKPIHFAHRTTMQTACARTVRARVRWSEQEAAVTCPRCLKALKSRS